MMVQKESCVQEAWLVSRPHSLPCVHYSCELAAVIPPRRLKPS